MEKLEGVAPSQEHTIERIQLLGGVAAQARPGLSDTQPARRQYRFNPRHIALRVGLCVSCRDRQIEYMTVDAHQAGEAIEDGGLVTCATATPEYYMHLVGTNLAG
jgi:hypothetical protein